MGIPNAVLCYTVHNGLGFLQVFPGTSIKYHDKSFTSDVYTHIKNNLISASEGH